MSDVEKIVSEILDLVSYRTNEGNRWGHDTEMAGTDEKATDILEKWLDENRRWRGGLLLTDGERVRFARWLKNEVDSSTMIIAQMMKLNVPSELIKKIEREADAAKIIADKLRETELTLYQAP